MLRCHLVQRRTIIRSSPHCIRECNAYPQQISYRSLSQLTNPKYHQISSNHQGSIKSNPFRPRSNYLKLQKRTLFSAPSERTVSIMLRGLFIYFLLYISYKFFSKREGRGARLEIMQNHCYSPFHINSILSLIYPKILGIFQMHSKVFIPNKYSKKDSKNDKHDIHSLITEPNNDYNIAMHQKVWIDGDNFKDKDVKLYKKFFDQSFLHSFYFDFEQLTFDEINFKNTQITKEWFDQYLSHSFDTNLFDPIGDIKFDESNSKNDEKNEKSEGIKPGIRMTLANTLRFNDDLVNKFEEIECSQVPFSEIAYFEKDTFSKYLKSDVVKYEYTQYQNHEIVVIPFKKSKNLSLILSKPMLDRDFILNDVNNEKYSKDDKYLKWSIHPHDLHHIFIKSEDSKNTFIEEKYFEKEVNDELFEQNVDKMKDDKESVNGNGNGLKYELMELYLPKISKEFCTELHDHHIVAAGLNTMWLPLYYRKLCLKHLDVQSFMDLNGENALFEMLTIGHFDNEQRVWFAMRWKYGLRDVALNMNWYNFKQKFRWKGKDKKEQSDDGGNETETEHKTLVFDRPFDYYLYDSCNQIVYAAGTISGS